MPGSRNHDRLPDDHDGAHEHDDRGDGDREPEDRGPRTRPRLPESSLPPPRTRAGEILAQSRETGRFLASLDSTQFQSLVLLLMVAFVCSLFGYQMWRSTEQHREDKANVFRYAENQSEIVRQAHRQELGDLKTHFQKESLELRQFFIEQDKRRDERETARDERHIKAEGLRDELRAKYETEERQKDRATVALIVAEQIKWREALKPLIKNAGCEDDPDGLFQWFLLMLTVGGTSAR